MVNISSFNHIQEQNCCNATIIVLVLILPFRPTCSSAFFSCVKNQQFLSDVEVFFTITWQIIKKFEFKFETDS